MCATIGTDGMCANVRVRVELMVCAEVQMCIVLPNKLREF